MLSARGGTFKHRQCFHHCTATSSYMCSSQSAVVSYQGLKSGAENDKNSRIWVQPCAPRLAGAATAVDINVLIDWNVNTVPANKILRYSVDIVQAIVMGVPRH